MLLLRTIPSITYHMFVICAREVLLARHIRHTRAHTHTYIRAQVVYTTSLSDEVSSMIHGKSAYKDVAVAGLLALDGVSNHVSCEACQESPFVDSYT